jgi:hypothetical protein
MRLLFVLLFAALPALAQGPESITVLERREIALDALPGSPSHVLRLTLVYLDGSGWTPDVVAGAAKASARILGQCGLTLRVAELVRVAAPNRYHDFRTPTSRELAATLQLAKPTVYFVANTAQRPAFDAEAIGRGNSRTRPELTDTVWVTRGTRDLGIAVTHELVHVLTDSGEHTDEPENLMRDETAPGNTRLSPPQCARLRETGAANGLLNSVTQPSR